MSEERLEVLKQEHAEIGCFLSSRVYNVQKHDIPDGVVKCLQDRIRRIESEITKHVLNGKNFDYWIAKEI